MKRNAFTTIFGIGLGVGGRMANQEVQPETVLALYYLFKPITKPMTNFRTYGISL